MNWISNCAAGRCTIRNQATGKLKPLQVTKLVDIQLLDHLVVTQDSFTRIRENTHGIWV
jgi:hypothetical protein